MRNRRLRHRSTFLRDRMRPRFLYGNRRQQISASARSHQEAPAHTSQGAREHAIPLNVDDLMGPRRQWPREPFGAQRCATFLERANNAAKCGMRALSSGIHRYLLFTFWYRKAQPPPRTIRILPRNRPGETIGSVVVKVEPLHIRSRQRRSLLCISPIGR